MRYRVWQVVLNVLGVIFLLGLLAPKPKLTGGGTAAALGTLTGLVLSIVLVIACFGWAYRFGKKAKATRNSQI